MAVQVKPERTGWRDLEMSARHRTWGIEFVAFDVDFILLECTGGCRPAAIIEYKCNKGIEPDKDNGCRALKWLGNEAFIPALLVLYRRPSWEYFVIGLNHVADTELELWQKAGHGGPKQWWRENEYQNFLRWLKRKIQ